MMAATKAGATVGFFLLFVRTKIAMSIIVIQEPMMIPMKKITNNTSTSTTSMMLNLGSRKTKQASLETESGSGLLS